MARELFAAGFVSCWAELEESMREALVRSLEAALASPSIPPEIVTTLLNLAEFMEHNEKKLPLDTRQAFSACLRVGMLLPFKSVCCCLSSQSNCCQVNGACILVLAGGMNAAYRQISHFARLAGLSALFYKLFAASFFGCFSM